MRHFPAGEESGLSQGVLLLNGDSGGHFADSADLILLIKA